MTTSQPDLLARALDQTERLLADVGDHLSEPSNCEGWTIEDLEGEHRYRFPYAFVLGIGAWVRVHSGRDSFEDRPTDLQWMRGYVWTDSGGAAKLIDPQGRIVSVWGY